MTALPLLATPECEAVARALASQLAAVVTFAGVVTGRVRDALDALPPQGGALVLEPEGLGLYALDMPGSGAVRVELAAGALGWRLSPERARGELVVKACGLKKKTDHVPLIFDATAGLARDACVLAAAGARVLAAERSPVIAALLEDGFRRAQAHAELLPLLTRLEFRAGDSRQLLADLAGSAEKPDVVYLDPMFPHREKSALVKKEMRVFRDVVGEDGDADDLLPLALTAARRRVVVKRPRLAPVLAGRKPALVMEGKSGRFDIYLL